MFKSEKAPETIKKLVTLTPIHVEYIHHFMEEKGILSEADVVRQAISYFHVKTFPDYIHKETPSETEKKKRRKVIEEFDAMTDEEFIEKNLKDPLFINNRKGVPYLIVHFIGNSLKAYPVQGAKKLFSEFPDFITHHNSKVESGLTIESQLTPYAKSTLRDIYDIVIE